MKGSGWMLHLLLLCAAYPAARAACPPLEGSPGLFHERVEWSYNKDSQECRARKVGALGYTSMRQGESQALTSLANDCLKFACGPLYHGGPEFSFHTHLSACTYRDGCNSGSIQSEGTCSLKYLCDKNVYNASRTEDEGGVLITGVFTVYTRYRCSYYAASGPCPLDQCFDFRAPMDTADVCLPLGTIVQETNPMTSEPYDLQCQEQRPCADDDISFVAWGLEIQDIPTPTPAPPSTTTSVPLPPETTTAPETEPPVPTVPTTLAPETEPPGITLPTTVAPEPEPPVITLPTNPAVPTVIFATLDTTKCRPSKRTCKFPDNTQGCKYRRQCYPVNTSISWDDCTQFQCHGSADGRRGSDFPRSTWLPRYIGCYGPSGCVTFGQQVRDAETNALYTCTYTMGELGFPVPEFRREEEGGLLEENMEVP